MGIHLRKGHGDVETADFPDGSEEPEKVDDDDDDDDDACRVDIFGAHLKYASS